MGEVAVTTVSKRGQVVIPKEIRDELGLKQNAGVAMKTVDGKLVLTRIQLSDKDFELKESFVKKMKKREKMKGFLVDSFAKRYELGWMYRLVVLPVVDRIFLKLKKKDKKQLLAINKKIVQLQANPFLGKPLHFPLQNLRRVHILKSFVLVYDIQEKQKTITIRAYDHHDRAYKK